MYDEASFPGSRDLQTLDDPASGPGEVVRAASINSALIELRRVDIEIWGDPVDAAVMRCLASARLGGRRGSRVSDVAAALDLANSTVHARLQRLIRWRHPADGRLMPLVARRVEGYLETREARALHDEAMRRFSPALRRLARGIATEA